MNSSAQSKPSECAHEWFEQVCGTWAGVCRTWFEPDQLADESPFEGRFGKSIGGNFLRHQYSGEIQNSPRVGEELFVFNPVGETIDVSWADSFHMSSSIMLSRGKLTGNTLDMTGQYMVGVDIPDWGWRTVYDLTSSDELVITAFNISPEGESAKALETKCRRLDDTPTAEAST
ncbi:hypothetical protein KOR42_10240 [Thalassoglobus neptunius]|uniref:DUF1579 domain-containing protein n=1 Tax=Thalassoglobus neptunius TaxID=1938619 RepID=A0A5C5X5Q7_9PLAN|nr:DUF1579 family protein [Thalassoglobus neptunius]TWT57661.1 hypothetical protein KOR42_10240 [Thalassoglobus neptunius]